jgi:hypothetical protein
MPQYTAEETAWKCEMISTLRDAGVPLIKIILDPRTRTIWTPDKHAKNLIRCRQVTLVEALEIR